MRFAANRNEVSPRWPHPSLQSDRRFEKQSIALHFRAICIMGLCRIIESGDHDFEHDPRTRDFHPDWICTTGWTGTLLAQGFNTKSSHVTVTKCSRGEVAKFYASVARAGSCYARRRARPPGPSEFIQSSHSTSSACGKMTDDTDFRQVVSAWNNNVRPRPGRRESRAHRGTPLARRPGPAPDRDRRLATSQPERFHLACSCRRPPAS